MRQIHFFIANKTLSFVIAYILYNVFYYDTPHNSSLLHLNSIFSVHRLDRCLNVHLVHNCLGTVLWKVLLHGL